MTRLVILVLFFLLAVQRIANGQQFTRRNCSCVAFRLDDIQDYFVTKGQIAVIKMFMEEGVPLSIGIIANEYGNDATITTFVESVLANVSFEKELFNHGWIHEDFSTFTLSEQIDLLTRSNNKITQDLGMRPTVFVPPFNSFNDDTITAVTSVGFTYFSAQDEIDLPPYDLNNPSLWHFPIGAQTNNEELPYFHPVPANLTYSDMKIQLARDGFSAIMMHPMEFHQWTGSQYDPNLLNQTALNELRVLLRMMKSSGLTLTLLSKIPQYLRPNITAPPTTGVATTGVPATTAPVLTPGTTGAASATTGVDVATTAAVSSSGSSPPTTSSSVQTSSTSASESSGSITLPFKMLGLLGLFFIRFMA